MALNGRQGCRAERPAPGKVRKGVIPIETRGGVLFGGPGGTKTRQAQALVPPGLLARKREILLSMRSDDTPAGCWLGMFVTELRNRDQQRPGRAPDLHWQSETVRVKTRTYKSHQRLWVKTRTYNRYNEICRSSPACGRCCQSDQRSTRRRPATSAIASRLVRVERNSATG